MVTHFTRFFFVVVVFFDVRLRGYSSFERDFLVHARASSFVTQRTGRARAHLISLSHTRETDHGTRVYFVTIISTYSHGAWPRGFAQGTLPHRISPLKARTVICLIVLVSGVLHPTHARLSLEQRRPDLNLHREPHLGRPRVPQTHQPLRRRDLDHLEGDASWCERRQQRQAVQ